jgi:hypothetical protein
VRAREREASIVFARKLRKLWSVGWSSFFAYHQDAFEMEGVDEERATTVFIWRGNRRIKARCLPW